MAEVSKQWYVINSYTGHENTVKDNLIRRIETMNVQNKAMIAHTVFDHTKPLPCYNYTKPKTEIYKQEQQLKL